MKEKSFQRLQSWRRLMVSMLCWLGVIGLLMWGQTACRPDNPNPGEDKKVTDGSDPKDDSTPTDDTNPPKDDTTPTDDTNPKDDTNPPKDDSKPTETTIMDVQNPDSPNAQKKGDAVILKGVVVVSRIFVVSSSTGLQGFYVADPTFPAQKWGGVQIVVDKDFNQDLKIGDKVDIEGAVDEFSGNTQVVARGDRGGIVTKTGTVDPTTIKPVTVTTADIPSTPDDKTAPDSSKAEPYEGVFVELKDVEVEEGPDQFGLWKITGGVVVDDNFFRGFSPKKGDKIAYVRGILIYSFDLYRLVPRSADDIDGATPQCTKDDDCGPGRKCNNGNCEVINCTQDSDCKTGETCVDQGGNKRCVPPTKTATVMDVQNPQAANHVPKGSPVELKGVIVTSGMFDVSANLKGFFVSDPSFPNEWGGVMVVISKDWTETVVVGDELDLKGTVDEFYNNTQVKVDLTAGGAATKSGNNMKDKVKAIAVALADIPSAPDDSTKPDESKSEKYEGMLIEFTDVTVSAEADKNGEWQIDGGFIIDDVMFGATPKVGDKFKTLRGIIQFNFGKYRLLPRDANDLVQ